MKALISLSGGLDSTTLASYLLSDEFKGVTELEAVSFYYGSKHNKYENEAAVKVAKYFRIPLIFIDLSVAFHSFDSALLINDRDIPEGHYQAENMRQTVVPARNMIFTSILFGLAESRKIPYVALGVHAGDHFIYPDCRPEFITAIDIAGRAATDKKVSLLTPFLMFGKDKIISLGHQMAAPFHLTRTCYKDQPIACGVCGSCSERKEAFALNGLTDPIQYEA